MGAKKSTSTSPVQPNADAPKANADSSTNQEEQLKKDSRNAEPLAPPPPRATEPDYFSAKHQILSTESNPFEYSFAGGTGPLTNGLVTPGGTKLPSVAALTSPALNFWSSGTGLRSGPLSPAMLTGPTKDDTDYFGDSYLHRGGPQPTQRESDVRSGMTPSERTGLTPGGGGSMFPEPSPGGSSIFNSLAKRWRNSRYIGLPSHCYEHQRKKGWRSCASRENHITTSRHHYERVGC